MSTEDYHRISERWTRYEYYLELKKFHTKVPSVVSSLARSSSSSYLTDRIGTDLMWSDPDDVDNWAVSPRGAGWLFGGSVTREVCLI